MKRYSDKERLDWMEENWDPRHRLRPVLKQYEMEDITIRKAIDSAMRREGRNK